MIIDKDTIKYITQNITPEEAEYVSSIRSTLDDANVNNDKQDDVIFLTKILAFKDKINILHWEGKSIQYKQDLDQVKYQMDFYINDIQPNIQSIIGKIDGTAISKLELPISDNILEILNELKICVHNWYKLHEDDIEYEGCRYYTSQFLANIHKFIYQFRLNKISDKNYVEDMSVPNPDTPIIIKNKL